MTCPHAVDVVAHASGDPRSPHLESHVASCESCRQQLQWDRRLLAEARTLGARLERDPFPTRRRPRMTALAAAAALLLVAAAGFLLRPADDPASTIEAQYRDVARLEALLQDHRFDPETRRAFRDAVTRINHAIELSTNALRRSPHDPDCAELVHVAYRAKRRLIETCSERSR